MPMQFFRDNLLYFIVSTNKNLKHFFSLYLSGICFRESVSVSDSICCAVEFFGFLSKHLCFFPHSTFFFLGGVEQIFLFGCFRKEILSQYWGYRDISELSHRLTLIFKMNHGGPPNCYCRERETLHYNKIRKEAGIGKTGSREFYNIDLQTLGI